MLTSETLTIEEMEQVLRDHGVRITGPRRAIWKLFRDSPHGMTITTAVEAVQERGIGLATVYRTVEVFERAGLLQRVHNEQGDHLFVTTRPGHYHPLVCRSCGKVLEFEGCDLSDLQETLARESGFRIDGHELEVFGTCPECQARRNGQ